MRRLWKSNSCDTCRKRKVKCDQGKPIGRRCTSSKRKCQRLYLDDCLVSSLPSASTSSCSTLHDISPQKLPCQLKRLPRNLPQGYQYQIQLLSCFVTEFVHTNSVGLQTFSYFEDMPSHHGESICNDIGSAALSLVYLGQTRNDKNLLYLSQYYYQLLVEAVLKAKHPTKDIITAATILSMYEVYNPLQTSYWPMHVRKACKFLENRGPEKPFNPGLLCLIRTLGFYDSIGRRKATLLQNPGWNRLIPKNELFEQLLSIVLCLPHLEELCDKTQQEASEGVLHNRAHQRFICQFRAIHSKLSEWYIKFLYLQKSCPFIIRAAEPMELSFIADHPELLDTFPEAVIFPDRYTYQLLVLCWMGFFVLNNEVSKVMRIFGTTIEYAQYSSHILAANQKCSHLEFESTLAMWPGSLDEAIDIAIMKVDERTELFANRICQTLVYANRYAEASAIKLVILSPLWILQHYFLGNRERKRSMWCQYALQCLPAKNIGYGTALAKLSLQQYSELNV